MIEFLKNLFDKIAPRKQHESDNFYFIKISGYYFALWYIIYLMLLYIIVKTL